MKTCKILVLVISLLGMYSCENEIAPETEGNGEVLVSVASRGVYQFLIQINDTLYYPENLPIEYKVISHESIPVHIRFQLLDYQQDIFQPAPNDVPIFLKKLPVIRLISIEKV